VRFVIYGAGAIGGVMGGRLAEAGHEVALIARGPHLDALRSDGLTVESPDRTVNLRLTAVGRPDELTFVDTDVVLFTMKTQHTVAAANALGAVAPPGITIVSAQNGVQNERMLIRRFANVYGICVMCPATHLDPGIVQAYSSPTTGLLDIGRWAGPVDDTALAIASAINDTTFESEPRDAIARWKYGKLLMNLGNASTALPRFIRTKALRFSNGWASTSSIATRTRPAAGIGSRWARSWAASAAAGRRGKASGEAPATSKPTT
jgi:2-dehydropantoate 2-reductase